MANDALGVTWDPSIPVLGSDRREGAQEIRGLRAGVAVRMNKEHRTLSGSTAPADGGEHLQGSAMIYTEADIEARSTRPDGSEALTSNDEGRIGVHTGTKALWYYDGSDWVQTASINPNHTPQSIHADVISAIGWTNGTGKNVLVSFHLEGGNPVFSVVVTDSSDVEQLVISGGYLNENRRIMFGAVIVPIGKVLRTIPTQSIAGTVTYSEL